MITLQLACLAEALAVEKALVARARSIRNISKEVFTRAPECPEASQELDRHADELMSLADEIGHQATAQARRDTDVSQLSSDESYLSLISQPVGPDSFGGTDHESHYMNSSQGHQADRK